MMHLFVKQKQMMRIKLRLHAGYRIIIAKLLFDVDIL